VGWEGKGVSRALEVTCPEFRGWRSIKGMTYVYDTDLEKGGTLCRQKIMFYLVTFHQKRE